MYVMAEEELIKPNDGDLKILKKIEDLLGIKLEQVSEIDRDIRGYIANKNGAVTGLGLAGYLIGDLFFKAVAEKFASLTSLTKLNLSHTGLTNISALSSLTNLTMLDLSHTELANISALSSLTSLTRLDLSHTELTNISALSSLTSLTRLDLSHTELTNISVLSSLTSLTNLNLERNILTDISALSSMTSLTMLDLGGNKLANISTLSSLTSLTGLHLGGNQLTDISALSSLMNLSRLNLRYNQLTDILALSSLTSLTWLDLEGNQLTELPALSSLTSLTNLNLERNILTDISALSSLTSLTGLHLGGNQLTDISALSSLMNLSRLNLHYNQLTDTLALSSLTSLTGLDLGGNQLTDISALSSLMNLSRLNLHQNAICELPEWITKWGMEIYWDLNYSMDGIIVGGNPLESPPVEIVQQGKEAIRNYFDSLKTAEAVEDGVVRLYEGKLLIVGEGDVGKTFIANQLMFDKVPDGKTTDGIDIHEWTIDTGTIKDFRVNLWDFAGQAICHATHQFFLTSRSLYLFVWEARSDQDVVSFDYWLNIIKLLSNGSPVLMVMNKCDSRVKAIDQAAIQKEFGNVIGFYDISALEGIGIEQLRQRIYTEMANLPMIGKKLPRQWADIRKQLEAIKEKNYIPYQEYVNICGEHGLNIDQAANLAQYYHDLGVILHFKDDEILKEIVILNPEWATDAVYAVVDNMDIQKAHGHFGQNLLKKAWADYPSEIHMFLMELMKKFELCFELPGKKGYIVPELLSPSRPEFVWDDLDNLHFEYQYDFMPAGIITRFTVRQHEIIENDLYWKNGVCLKWNDTRARIICDPFAKTISIMIKGVDPKGMLGVIRRDIEAIHETLNRPEHDERIPCICPVCKAGDKLIYHSYEKIKELIKNGNNTSQCDKGSDVSIQSLLGEYGIDYRSQQSRYDDMERPRVDDRMQEQVLDAVKEIHSSDSTYSKRGMIFGALAMVGGVILTLCGAIGKTSWTASVMGMESELTDAGPGVVLMVIGLFVILITKPKPILKQLIGIIPKLKRDGQGGL